MVFSQVRQFAGGVHHGKWIVDAWIDSAGERLTHPVNEFFDTEAEARAAAREWLLAHLLAGRG
jgi:hypothetical protein